MDSGEVKEFDSPYNLLTKNENDEEITNVDSIFAQMVLATGKESSKYLFDESKKKYLSADKGANN